MDWRNLPSLAALRAFEAAARHGSFTKAAAELNVTHAAIAQHVRALEAEFAEPLIVRQGRGVVATRHGQSLAEQLTAGFSVIADSVADLRAIAEDRPLNITLTPAFAANWLMPRIGDFWTKHPDILLNISPNTGLVDLRTDGYDIGLRFGDGNWPGLQSELLTDGDFWVVAQPKLLEGRRLNCLPDVVDLPWIMESQMMERRAVVEREGVCFDDIDVSLMSTNGLVMSAAKAGLGVTIQPKSLVESEVEAGGLQLVCALNQEGIGYHIVTVPGREPKGLRVFVKWLRSKAEESKDCVAR